MREGEEREGEEREGEEREGGREGKRGRKAREGEKREGGKEGQKEVVVFTLAKIVFTNEIRIITNITAVLKLMVT